MALAEVGIALRFEGVEEHEVGIIDDINHPLFQAAITTNNEPRTTTNNQPKIGQVIVRVDPQYYRPTEVDLLIGDPTKSKTQLCWKPQYDLAGLVKEMVACDLQVVKRK
jgi:GDPmannose 4,6-dehydratase